MMPVIAGKLSLPGGKPISERWFGLHKTWRGFYAGYFGALVVLVVQAILARNRIMEDYAILNYLGGGFLESLLMAFGYAFLFGVGAIFGDLVKSFLKRRIGIKPGASWFPLDQLDFVIGAMLCLWPFVELPGQVVAMVLVATPVVHFLVNVLGYLVGLKKVWW